MNKKGNKGNTIIAVIVYVVMLLVCVSMFFPRNVGSLFKVDSVAEKSYTAKDVATTVGCELKEDGQYTILDVDPQIIIPVTGENIESLRFAATSRVEQVINFEVFTALADGEFSSERCYQSSILLGQEDVVVDIPKGNYSYLRIDINSTDIVFKGIELFDEQPTLVPFTPVYSTVDYIITILFPIISAVAAWFINKKFRYVERAMECLSKNKLQIATVAVFAVLALLVSILIEIIISLIASDGVFNFYRWIIMAGIAEIIIVFVFGYKALSNKPENLFLPIILILGAVMLFGSPLKHICWDLDSHYPWAVQASYPGTTYITGSYTAIDTVSSQSLISGDKDCDFDADLAYLSQADEILVSQTRSEFSLAHLPSGVVIAVARWFGADFETKYNLGRLAYLLIYSFVCYFAIKKIKSGKMILATICLFPTNLFLATNYSYDWCVTAFCILGTAYFVSEIQQPDKPISVKDTVIMGAAFALGAIPKLVYIVIMGMTLFMRKNWASKQEKRRYYMIIVGIFIAVMLMFMLRANSSLSGGGDLRGGAVNPGEQVAGILSNPFGYVKMLSKFLFNYLSVGRMKEYISHFAYLGLGSYWGIFVASLMFTAATDTDGKTLYKIPVYMRLLSVALYIGMAVLIASALYISFTPVGLNTVNGCQARYITPLLAPIILIVTGSRFNVIKNKAAYNGCILGLLTAGVLMETYSQIIKIMI